MTDGIGIGTTYMWTHVTGTQNNTHTHTHTHTYTYTHTHTHTINYAFSYHMQSNDGARSILRYHHRFLVFSIPVLKIIGEEVVDELQVTGVIVPSIVAINQDDIRKLGLQTKQV